MTVVTVSPLGGGADDAAAVQTVLNANPGAKIVFEAGTYDWQTPCLVPSNSWIEFRPGVTISSTIAPTVGDGQSQAVFRAVPLGLTGATATHITAAINPGDLTATLDSMATPTAFDIGGFGSTMENMELDNGGTGLACVSCEGGEEMLYRDIKCFRSGPPVSASIGALSVLHTMNSTFERIYGEECGNGLAIGGGTGVDVESSRGNVFLGCEFVRSTQQGLIIGNGSSDNQFYGCKFNYSEAFGAQIYDGIDIGGGVIPEPTRGNQFHGCQFNHNGGGVLIESGTADTLFVNVQTVGNGPTEGAINTAGSCRIVGWDCRENALYALAATSPDVSIKGLRIDQTVAGGFSAFVLTDPNAYVVVDDAIVNITSVGTTAVINITSGLLAASNLKASGSIDFGVLLNTTNAKFVRAHNVDITAAATDYNISGGGKLDFGVAALSGGTVTVTTPMVKADSRITLTPRSVTNQGMLRISAITAGTSFVITSSNGADASAVEWTIVE